MKGIDAVVVAPAAADVPSKKDNKRKPAAAAKEKKPKKAKEATVRKAPKEKKPRSTGKKDPNLPKKPASAYLIFLADFRPAFKKDNPESKGVQEVTKAAGAKWKEMSEKEKEPYTAKAALLKSAYTMELSAYENKSANEGSGETKSEIADDAEDSTADGM